MMTLEEAKRQIQNDVYAAGRLFEDLEYEGRIFGNGHHMRQELAEKASDMLAERWIEAPKESTTP